MVCEPERLAERLFALANIRESEHWANLKERRNAERLIMDF
jgi:hypothetical protein